MDSKFLYLPKSLPVDDDNVTNYNKQQFENDNMLMNETDNLVTSSGQTVSPSDDEQLSKGVSNYVSVGNFFIDESINAVNLILDIQSTFKAPTSYFNGMEVKFVATHTGYSTVDLCGLGEKVLEGIIEENIFTSIRYDGTKFIKIESGSNGGGGYIGQFSYGARLDVPEGQLRCDGSPYTKSQFPTFFTSYLVGAKKNTYSFYATYASEILANGVCGSFALDEVGETFKTYN